MRIAHRFGRIGSIVLYLVCFVGVAGADSVQFDLTTEFSGADQPANVPTAIISDGVGANKVRLTMSMSNVSGGELEAIDDWYFNFTGDATTLTFTAVNVSAVANWSASTGSDAFGADGGGLYDIKIDFPPPPGTFAAKFTAGESVIIDIGGAGITPNHFVSLSAPQGDNGVHYSAAHVQGVGSTGQGSGWVGPGVVVPLPAAAWMGMSLLGGVGGVGFFRRRRHVEA